MTDARHASEASSKGVKVAMLELDWAAYEPTEGNYNSNYIKSTQSHLAALKAAGMQVTLALGLHYSPNWAFAYPDSRYVDNRGQSSSELNLVFNQVLRSKADRYFAQLDKDFGLENFWAVRLTAGGNAEVLYPGTSYWAFDKNAQNGSAMPASMKRNPLPGWKPGNRSVSTSQVGTWAAWYTTPECITG